MNTKEFLKICKKEGVENYPLLCEIYHRNKGNKVNNKLVALLDFYENKKALAERLNITVYWLERLMSGNSCSTKLLKQIDSLYDSIYDSEGNFK